MLEQIFFTLGKFLAGLVFAEAVATAFHACSLNRQDEVIVILAVEERHQALFPGKAPVDEQVFLIMAHRVAQIHVFHPPSTRLKLVDNHPVEVLLVHRIV